MEISAAFADSISSLQNRDRPRGHSERMHDLIRESIHLVRDLRFQAMSPESEPRNLVQGLTRIDVIGEIVAHYKCVHTDIVAIGLANL
jgi:hypothetical protein